MIKMKKIFVILVVGIFVIFNANADIYSATSFKCVYYSLSIGKIKNNKYKVDNDKAAFGFNIVNINLNSSESEILGNMGKDSMTAINAKPSGIHFLHEMPTGNMAMTTIYPEEVGTTSLGQTLYSSSHSRHISAASSSLPQQYYGECVKLR